MVTVTRGKRDLSWNRETAEQRVRAWLASGLTQAEFARRNGFSKKTLGNWHRRLRAQGWTPQQAVSAALSLLPVRGIQSSPPRSPAGGSSAIEVELPCGAVVRVRPDFDEPTLAAGIAGAPSAIPRRW